MSVQPTPRCLSVGFVAELGCEAVGETVLWATMPPGVNNPSMHSTRPQTALTVDLSQEPTIVICLFVARTSTVSGDRFRPAFRPPTKNVDCTGFSLIQRGISRSLTTGGEDSLPKQTRCARVSVENPLERYRFAFLLHFLLLRRSDEPLSDVIVRLLQTRVAGIKVHAGVVHLQVQVRNLLAQVIPILVLLKLLA